MLPSSHRILLPIASLLAAASFAGCSDDQTGNNDVGADVDNELDIDEETEVDTDPDPEPELEFRAPQTEILRAGEVYTVLCIQRDAEGEESEGDLVVTEGEFEALSGVGEFLYTAPADPARVTFTCQWPEEDIARARSLNSLPASLVAYFPLDGDLSEATGSVDIDDTSLPQGASPAADHEGNEDSAVLLDGETALTIPHADILNVQGERTIMFRARIDPQGPDTVLLEKGASEDTSAYRVMTIGTDSDVFNLDLRYAHATVGDTLYSFFGPGLPADPEWVRIAVSVGEDERMFVLNDESNVLGTGNFPLSIENSSPLYIGNGGEGTNGLVGEIDNLLIFDAPLTETRLEEIWALY